MQFQKVYSKPFSIFQVLYSLTARPLSSRKGQKALKFISLIPQSLQELKFKEVFNRLTIFEVSEFEYIP